MGRGGDLASGAERRSVAAPPPLPHEFCRERYSSMASVPRSSLSPARDSSNVFCASSAITLSRGVYQIHICYNIYIYIYYYTISIVKLTFIFIALALHAQNCYDHYDYDDRSGCKRHHKPGAAIERPVLQVSILQVQLRRSNNDFVTVGRVADSVRVIRDHSK